MGRTTLTSLGIAAAVIGVALAPQAPAQSQKSAPVQPAFDAASLKIVQDEDILGLLQKGVGSRMKGGPGTSEPGRVSWKMADRRSLLTEAFDVELYRIVWPATLTGRERGAFALEATMPPETTKPQFRLMLQNLLIERFQLRVHHETRTYPGYELIVAPGGPKLKSTADPDAPDPPSGPTGERDKDGFLILPPGHSSGITMVDGVHESFHSFTMTELVGGRGSVRALQLTTRGPISWTRQGSPANTTLLSNLIPGASARMSSLVLRCSRTGRPPAIPAAASPIFSGPWNVNSG